MTITVNSDYEKLFGISYLIVYVSNINQNFNKFDELESYLSDLSEEEKEYIITFAKAVVYGQAKSSTMALTIYSYNVLQTVLTELEVMGYPLFEIATNQEKLTTPAAHYAYTVNIDGSGRFANTMPYKFIGRILYYAADVMCYPEFMMALYNGLSNKLNNGNNIAVTFNLSSTSLSKRICNAINSALTELDEWGEDISTLFIDGVCDDDYNNLESL